MTLTELKHSARMYDLIPSEYVLKLINRVEKFSDLIEVSLEGSDNEYVRNEFDKYSEDI